MAQDLPDGADLVGRAHVLLAMAGCRARSLDLMDVTSSPGSPTARSMTSTSGPHPPRHTRLGRARAGRLGPRRGDGRAGAHGGLHALLSPGSHGARPAPRAQRRSRPVDAARRGARGRRTDRPALVDVADRGRRGGGALAGRPSRRRSRTRPPIPSTWRSGSARRGWSRSLRGGAAQAASASPSRPKRVARSGCSSAATGLAPRRHGGRPAALRGGTRVGGVRGRGRASEARSTSSTGSALGPRRRSSRAACVSAACVGCRVGCGRRRRQIRRTSRRASSRCSGSWPRVSATPRWLDGWCCRSEPWLTTSRRSCASWAFAVARRLRQKPSGSGSPAKRRQPFRPKWAGRPIRWQGVRP